MGCCSSSSSPAPSKTQPTVEPIPTTAQNNNDDAVVTRFIESFSRTSPFVKDEDDIKNSSKIDTSTIIARIFKYRPNVGVDEKQRLNLQICPDTGAARPFTFFIKSESGLGLFLKNGKDNVFESLLRLGITESWIRDTLEVKQLKFAMIFLPKSASHDATWDSFIDAFAQGVPDELREYCEKYREMCKSEENRKFWETEEFKKKYGSIQAIENSSIEKDPDLFMTPKRFLERTEKGFIDFRVLLWTWGGANNLFAGDGFTVDSATGEKTEIEECLVQNWTVAEMKEKFGCQMVMLDVHLPKKN